jgi:uncharacterized protein YfaS (alpha-2-macroglobulin family)
MFAHFVQPLSFLPFALRISYRMLLQWMAAALCCCLILPAYAGAQPETGASLKKKGPIKILRVNPSGENVPAGRQIVFQFDRPIVPLGRMERSASEIPITIEPSLACQWRWLNPSALACQLDEKHAMIPATRYKITVRPGIVAEDGGGLPGPVTFGFVTERAKVSDVWLQTWISPGMPKIRVRFARPAREKSVADHLYFLTAKGVRVGVNLEEDPEFLKSREYTKGLVWLVSPKQELPHGEDVQLKVEPGILSVAGPEPGVENRVAMVLHTFPELGFLGLECHDVAGNLMRVPAGKPDLNHGRCSPARSVSLLFSAPIQDEVIKNGLQITPDLVAGRADYDPWDNIYLSLMNKKAPEKGQVFTVYFNPGVLKPYRDYHVQAGPGAITDEFGRKLAAPIDFSFSMDHEPPDYYMPKDMAVLEKGLDTDAHIWTTNLNRLKIDYDVLTAEGKRSAQTRIVDLPKAEDIPSPAYLGIRDMIGKESGLVQGQVGTEPAVQGKQPSEGWFYAQVTPFDVHVKLGHTNTTVWVTDLGTGQPVPGVDVQIFREKFKSFEEKPAVLSRGTTGDDGIAELAGASELDPDRKLSDSYGADQPHLSVRCLKGGDMASLPLTFDFRVDSEGSNHDFIPESLRKRYGHIHAWGATAQGIYKAGDTVQFKIYVRDQDNRRFVPAPVSPYLLKVEDPMGKTVYERKDIQLSQFGAFDGQFTIPKTGAVGWYKFELAGGFTDGTWEPMRVLVSDFTPSPFKVTTDLNGKAFGLGDKVEVTTQAKLHAGGPYTKAGTRITASVDAIRFTARDPKYKSFRFNSLDSCDTEAPSTQTLYQDDGKLDDTGSLTSSFTITETPVLYGRLTVESAVRDDRGKFVANRASATYFGRDRYVGISQEDWLLNVGTPAVFNLLVVDRDGNPATGSKIHVRVEREEVKASRVKGPGTAYLTDYEKEWVAEGTFDLVSGPEPVQFNFTPTAPGRIRVTAGIVSDSGGNQAGEGSEKESGKEGGNTGEQGSGDVQTSHQTCIYRHVMGKGHVLWETVPGNLLEVSSEKEEYKIGETARFLVQNPFPGAKALITVERFGVLKRWVRTLENATEVIEVPVEPDYLPGFYLSVVVVSPRVEKPLDKSGIDLGKPTFRMGYVTVPVTDPYKEIAVAVKPEKDVYKPRDTVSVELRAQLKNPPADSSAPPVELAVAVLDESVFELLLKGKEAFDPYRGFYSLDSLDLANYALVMHLIGRDKLEKKGANPGGGGGPDLSLRSVFKFVGYWNPSLVVDKDGKAKIEFQAPDNLTGWRILAMAVTPDDRMGLGDATFKVNRKTEIRPVLPNRVIEGDTFQAGFSVMNRTDQPRTIDVSVQAEGPVEVRQGEHAASVTQQIKAEPYQRYIVRLPIKTTGVGQITFTAKAGDSLDSDGLKQTLPVEMRQSLDVAAAYGTTDGGEAEQSIAFPADMRPDTGHVGVTVSPSVMGGVEGAFEYLKSYPYPCWEQKLSLALMAAYYQALKPYVAKSFTWKESTELPGKMLDLAAEHQAPNGGMVYYVPKDEYADPYLSSYTALAFGWLKERGYNVPAQVEEKLHKYLQTMLRKDVMPDLYTKGMASTVRAVALAALAEQGKATLADLQRYEPHVPEMSLFGKAHYLLALTKVAGTAKMQQAVVKAILAHANQTGGSLVFSEALDSGYRHILASSLRDNCAVFSALLAYHKANPSDASIGEMPYQLMRTIVQSRKGRDHWYSTQANLFAVKALADFSRIYEAKKPDMTLHAFLDKEPIGSATFKDLTEPPAEFDRPLKPEDVGRKAVVKLKKEGEGRFYYAATVAYSPAKLRSDAVNSGIEVHREYSVERNGSWTLLESPMQIKTGELVRVDLYVSLPAERHFVVVDDPVPGGLEPVNRDLATASTVDARKGENEHPKGSFWFHFDGWLDYGYSRWSFYHKELRFDSARFYSEYLAPGNYHLSYVAQAISPGEFIVLPTHAEEMYDPDVYGKSTPAELKVGPAE